MKLHANARTCPRSRRLVVDWVAREGWTLAAAAEAAGVMRVLAAWGITTKTYGYAQSRACVK
jgi:hypothetical protein